MWGLINFRQIFRQFRSEEEEDKLANDALYKFGGFTLLVMAMLIGRRYLLQSQIN